MFAEEALVFIMTGSAIRVSICCLPHSGFDLIYDVVETLILVF